ncbi:MAG: hypothetical protein Fur006_58580 [Coleofasciculaceae cyanobacterium]
MQLWAKRYVPDLSMLRSQTSPLNVSDLSEAASSSGRAKTVAKLERLLYNNCELAGIRTNALFTYIPKIVNLEEARRLSPCITQIYQKACSVYGKQSPSLSSLLARPVATTSDAATGAVHFSKTVHQEWTEPMLEQLITALEPLLGNLPEQLMLAPDRRTLGFMTTQFHFSSKLLLEKLTLAEQVLLVPYFKFVEEQVSIPWQQVCTAAAKYSPDTPPIKMVERCLPVTQEIASIVYRRTAQVYCDHRSRRGDLREVGVMNSTIRDLEMFQVYLWLCFLEKDMAALEQTLIPLCVLVFPSVGVKWELARQTIRFLVNEVIDRLEPAQRTLMLPYTQALQDMFADLERKAPTVVKDSQTFVVGSRHR